MRIDGLIENTLKNSRLKRVRVKVDPSQLVTRGYENVCSFEGYVLEENSTTVQVYLLNVPKEFDNVQTVDKKNVTQITAPTINPSYCNYKLKILKQLETEGIGIDSPVYKQIENCDSPDFIDSYLRAAGYTDDKLVSFYKQALLQEAAPVGAAANALSKVARGLQGIEQSSLFKLADVGAKAIAKAPSLIVGKKNIIGRLANFMKSFDVNDLINVDKYKLKSKEFPTEPSVGDSVYIKGLPFDNLPVKKFGNIDYQIRGVFESPKVNGKRKSNQIIEIFPMELRRQVALELDYAVLDNPDKTGTLIIDFLDVKMPTRYYKVKVDDFKNNLILTVVGRLDEKEGSVSWRLMQDEVVAAVAKSLEEFLGERKLENIDYVINTISANILENREKRLRDFDNAMVDLVQDKSALASTNPEMYIKKYLGPIGLYK